MASTAGRPPSAASVRPDTGRQAGAAARPGTASRLAAQAESRLGTARPGTGRGAGANVPERLRSGRLTTGKGRTGPRGTRDRAYYLAVLRSKVTEVTSETNKLSNASKDFAAAKDFLGTYRTEQATLSRAVADLRAVQYDYELMLEGIAKNVGNDEVEAEIDDYRQHNAGLTAELEDLLNDRQRREAELKKLQDKAKKYESAGESLLQEMSASDQARYRDMQEELTRLADAEEKLVADYEAVKNGERAKLEEELIFAPLKKEASQTILRIRELQTTLEDVKNQINRTPEQEQARLTEKIKADNAEIASLERQAQTLQTVLEILRQHYDGRQPTSREDVGAADRNNLFATFNEQKDALTETLGRDGAETIKILDQLTRNITALNELPISTEADILKTGQQFRSTVSQVKNEQRLRDDLLEMSFMDSSRELKKLETLSQALTTEKEQRSHDITKWEGEKRKALARGDTKEIVAKRQSELLEEKKNLVEQHKRLESQLATLVGDLTQKRANLQRNTQNQKIVATENQLQKLEAKTFDLEEVIADALPATAYSETKEQVMRKVKEVNKVLVLIAELEARNAQEND